MTADDLHRALARSLLDRSLTGPCVVGAEVTIIDFVRGIARLTFNGRRHSLPLSLNGSRVLTMTAYGASATCQREACRNPLQHIVRGVVYFASRVQWSTVARVAQGIEHRSPKAGVVRSNRISGTLPFSPLSKSGETLFWRVDHLHQKNLLRFAISSYGEQPKNQLTFAYRGI